LILSQDQTLMLNSLAPRSA